MEECLLCQSQYGKGNDKPVDKLPAKHTWHPLLLGQDVEESAKKIIHCIREAGGIINSSIVIGIFTGILCETDSNLLAENSAPILIDRSVAQRLLIKMQYVKRKGTTKAKIMPSDFQLLQTLFLVDIRTVATFKNIPANLILNRFTLCTDIIMDTGGKRVAKSCNYSHQ